MVLQLLPVLITSGDLLPGGGDLNGRRWAGQQLLRCWAKQAGTRPMALAHADPPQLQQLLLGSAVKASVANCIHSVY